MYLFGFFWAKRREVEEGGVLTQDAQETTKLGVVTLAQPGHKERQ